MLEVSGALGMDEDIVKRICCFMAVHNSEQLYWILQVDSGNGKKGTNFV